MKHKYVAFKFKLNVTERCSYLFYFFLNYESFWISIFCKDLTMFENFDEGGFTIV